MCMQQQAHAYLHDVLPGPAFCLMRSGHLFKYHTLHAADYFSLPFLALGDKGMEGIQ